MTDKPILKLDWCSHAAAKYAVEKWHYSKRMPRGKERYIGVWENEKYIGVLCFGTGSGAATNGSKYGLAKSFQMAELTRVALSKHQSSVSRIISIAIRLLLKSSPKLKMLVSYADPNENHHGGIYQASGWIYAGRTPITKMYKHPNGRLIHPRHVSERGFKMHYHKPTACLRPSESIGNEIRLGKHRYLMPLTPEIRDRILPLAKPYPKRATSIAGDASANHAEEGGSTPTVALS